jgi:hypothetical protein
VFFGQLAAHPVDPADTAGRAAAFTRAFEVSGLVTAGAFALVLLLTLALPARRPVPLKEES